MKKIIVFLFSISIYYSGAQVNSTSKKSFDELIKSYYKFIYKDPFEALLYANQARNLAEMYDNKEQLSKAFYYTARCYKALGKNKKALKNIELALSNNVSNDDIKFTYKYISLNGDILSELGENSKALKAYLKAKKLAVIIGDPEYEISAILNIAYIKKLHKDFLAAIGMYKTILKQSDTLENNSNIRIYRLKSFINIADSYLWLKETEKAEIYNESGLRECSDDKCSEYYTLLMNRAIIYYQRKQYEECILLSKKIKDAVLERTQRDLYITCLFYLGKSFYQLNDNRASVYHLEQALNYINNSENVDINEKELHEFLALLYTQLGNSEKSLFHFNQYRTLEKKKSANDLKIKGEMHKLIDITLLDSEIKEVKEALARQTRNKEILFFTSSILFVLLITSVVYYRRREKNKKRKFDELLKKVSKLEAKEVKQTVTRKEKVTDEKARIILNKIIDFEKKEYYLLLECSLGFMADKLETNTTYLSKVINKYKNKSFTAYVTELRINTALIRLKNDKTLQSYTVKAIAEEFGFKRQETFSKAFKAYTGIYPSQYLKKLKKSS